MFLVKLYDRKRQELSIGDIVAISDGKRLNFYCRITFLEKEQKLAPFHTFSFHSVEKVAEVPENAVPCSEDRYECWYMGSEAKPDESAAEHAQYLLDWRACERFLDKSCFDVVPILPTESF
jgi:hypothetical protein